MIEITNEAGTALVKKDETGYVANKDTAPVVRKTRAGEKPSFEEGDGEDIFEFEFENQDGQKKLLKFKAKRLEQ